MSTGAERVATFLRDRSIDARVVTLDESTRTSQLAAEALGCTVPQIAKSIAFKAGESAVIVVISGDMRVDQKKVSALIGIRAGFADAEAVLRLTSYPIGGVPPFPHGDGVRVLLDRSLDRFERVWAAAGTPNSVMQLRVSQLKDVVGGDFVDVAA